MSSQIFLQPIDFSTIEYDCFSLEFSRFLRFSFSPDEFEGMKSYIDQYCNSLHNSLIMSKEQVNSFFESFSKTFKVSFKLPKIPERVNFYSIVFFIIN